MKRHFASLYAMVALSVMGCSFSYQGQDSFSSSMRTLESSGSYEMTIKETFPPGAKMADKRIDGSLMRVKLTDNHRTLTLSRRSDRIVLDKGDNGSFSITRIGSGPIRVAIWSGDREEAGLPRRAVVTLSDGTKVGIYGKPSSVKVVETGGGARIESSAH